MTEVITELVGVLIVFGVIPMIDRWNDVRRQREVERSREFYRRVEAQRQAELDRRGQLLRWPVKATVRQYGQTYTVSGIYSHTPQTATERAAGVRSYAPGAFGKRRFGKR